LTISRSWTADTLIGEGLCAGGWKKDKTEPGRRQTTQEAEEDDERENEELIALDVI